MSELAAYRYEVAVISPEDGQRALFGCLDALRAVDRTPPVPSTPPA
jgi:hypothetical protein